MIWRKAIHYLNQNKQLNISTDNIILMGHSAGAFNVMSVVYSAQPQNLNIQDNIKAIVGFGWPVSF